MAKSETATANASTISNEIVEKVAEVNDVDPLELSPPLFEVVDTDALNQLFASTPTTGRMEGEVTFSYNGNEVTVSGDGYVTVQ